MEKKSNYNIVLNDGQIFNTITGINFFKNLNEEKNLNDELVKLEEKIKKLKPVYNTFDTCYVYIIFSKDCNLSCVYCFEKTTNKEIFKEKKSKELIEDYLEFIKKVKKLYKNVSITLYGGEPLLLKNYEFIKKILDLVETNDLTARVITNGLLIDRYIDLFSLYKNLKEITISIDGNKNIHDARRISINGDGSYEKILNNIKLILAKFQIKLSIRVNLDKTNAKFQEDMLDDLISINNENLSVWYYKVTNNTDSYIDNNILKLFEFAEIMDQLITKYKSKIKIKSGVNMYNHIKDLLEMDNLIYPRLSFCNYGYMYVLNSDGNIYSCPEAMSYEKFKVSSIEKFLKNSSSLKQKEPLSILEENNACSKCEVNTICGGGCKFSKSNKNLFCEKNDIIKTINDMYFRRKTAHAI